MELTENEIFQKNANLCGYCRRVTLLPYEYEFTCFACGYNLIRRKHQLSKISRERINFIKRFKNAEHKIFCIIIIDIIDDIDTKQYILYICIDVYRKCEGWRYICSKFHQV